MSKRVKTKIGDIFSVPINKKEKRFIQFIAFDLLQLNSDVIRCFNKIYPLEADPKSEEIINDRVLFYGHCATDLGLKLNLWKNIGNSSDIGHPQKILFRNSEDYARKAGDDPVKMSHKWYVWRVNDKDFTDVGKLKGENRDAFIGLVFNPYGVLELVKGNKYPLNYPDFE